MSNYSRPEQSEPKSISLCVSVFHTTLAPDNLPEVRVFYAKQPGLVCPFCTKMDGIASFCVTHLHVVGFFALGNLASSGRSVSQGAAQKTAREKIKKAGREDAENVCAQT